MLDAPLTGRALRLSRLSRSGDGRFLFVPMDHSLSDGPIVPAPEFAGLVRDVVAGGADAIVVHKGRARLLEAAPLRSAALVVHLSAGTAHSLDDAGKTLVGTVEEAVRAGADAVSVHVNIGSRTEPRQLADLGAVAAAADHWGMPLLAMVYVRGPGVADPCTAELVSHVVNIAADLGADLVKTAAARPSPRMADVVANSPIPVLVAGGDDGSDLLGFARTMMTAGCHGLAVGRRVFRHPAPRRLVSELAAVVHGTSPAELPSVAWPRIEAQL